jgi:membrane peptidoglycan carboxypeptidase
MSNAYATFANNGKTNDITTIERIENKEGKITYEYKPKERTVISPESAFLISSILSDNKARQEEFGNVLTISRPAAVKTGTSEDYRDSLTLGYTPQIAVGVWVGNNDNQAMSKIAGSIGAAPIWRDLMTHFLANQPVISFTKPEGVIAAGICRDSGLLAKGGGTIEYFIEGTEPTRSCGYNRPMAQSPSITISPLPTISQPVAPTPAPSVPVSKPSMEERTAHVEALLHEQVDAQNSEHKKD